MVAKVPPAGITTYKGTPSAGDLGVGLHIKSADSGGSVTSTADELVVEGSGDTGIQILSGASSEAGIAFGDSGDSNIGLIGYDHANNRFRFKTNDAVQWYLDSSGNWLPAATDHGIYLGVTTATASNLLDDYEEGTWTGVFKSTNGNFTMDSSYTTGLYTKVGNIVSIQAYLAGTAESLSDSDTVLVGGLPFTAASGDTGYCSISVGYVASFADSQNYSIGGYVNNNSTDIQLTRMMDITSGATSLRVEEITENGQIIFQCTYRAA